MSNHSEIEGMTANTIRAMRAARHLIDDKFEQTRKPIDCLWR